MNKRFVTGFILLILFTTFISKNEISLNKFKVKTIEIENNEIFDKKKLINDISFLYERNMIFLNSHDIKKRIQQKSLIKSLKIKKIYPNKLVIKISERKPIAILIDKDKKYFLGKKLVLIEYKEISKYKNLPLVYGDRENFEILFNNLKKINFPIEIINEYYFFETKRWDFVTKDEQTIKLSSNNYDKSLKNFLKIKDQSNFEKYKIFDYRLSHQLILR
tara:strand:+ start:1849 stop:2505 length:657 start_codon:yes stop_codon:yes gene_type:complete